MCPFGPCHRKFGQRGIVVLSKALVSLKEIFVGAREGAKCADPSRIPLVTDVLSIDHTIPVRTAPITVYRNIEVSL